MCFQKKNIFLFLFDKTEFLKVLKFYFYPFVFTFSHFFAASIYRFLTEKKIFTGGVLPIKIKSLSLQPN